MSGPAPLRPQSPLLLRQLQEAFGTGAAADPAVQRLVERVDATYLRLAALQKAGSDFGRVVACEINLATGRIEAGRAWKTLLGYGSDALEDTLAAWQALLPAEEAQALLAALAGGDAPFTCDCRFRARDGERHWLRVSGQVAERDAAGRALRATVAVSDVDAWRRAEASLQAAKEVAEVASRTRSAFLANMSHEIRTPMNAVLGMTELVLGTSLDAEQRHYLAVVKSSAEALLTIIDDILDFSKIEAGKLAFERVDFSPRGLLFEAMRAMALKAQEKGLEVLVSVAPQVPERLWGDPTRLRQVVTNLVGNAIKFTEQGEVALEVTADGSTRDAAELRFCVRDTGIGVPADKQQAIFEAFAQADLTITRRFGGTGLGLAICNRLVELMGGRIWVESEPGAGSRFLFTGRFGIEAAAAATPPPQRLAGRRVLLVMANAAGAGLTAATLRDTGGRVHPASEPAAALAALAAAERAGQPFDLLVADAPLLTGDDAALINAWSAAGKRPVVALHTLCDQQAGSAALRALGVDCHVIKPFAPEDLLEAAGLAQGEAGAARFQLDAFTVDENLARASAPSPASLEVLLVEDNPINQELAVRLLEKGGHRVSVANNGEEALTLFDQQHFEVILMDVQMPVMGGIECTEAIRARELRRSWIFSADRLPGVSIIAMTANAMAGDRERCLQAGMNDYLAKPIRQADLYAALARAAAELGRSAPAVPAADGRAPAAPTSGIDLAATERDLGDRDLAFDLARTLLAEWERHVGQLESAFAADDADALMLHAHTIKGFLAMFHADSGKEKARALEKAAHDRDWPGAERWLGELRLELEQIKPLLARAVEAR